MKKFSPIFWIVGVCVFVAVILTGTNWIVVKCGGNFPNFTMITNYAKIAIIVLALIIGLFWCLSFKKRPARLVFAIIYIAFAVLSLLGIFPTLIG